MTAVSEDAQDHYAVLGVPVDADPAEVKRAYRALARSLHPDVNPDPAAAQRFAQVTEAHAVLSSPTRRTAYDTARRAARVTHLPAAHQAAPAPAHRTNAGTAEHSPFAAGTTGGHLTRGVDLHAAATVPFTGAATGAVCDLLLRFPTPCPGCAATGYADTGPRRVCPGCDGLGMVIATGDPCGHCHGRGTITDTACDRCTGTGQVSAETRKTVNLPAGISSGQKIRLARQGGPGTGGGPPGDLYVTVTVAPHPLFQPVSGHPLDVGLVLPVRYTELLLGADIPVPTLTGDVATFTLPPGSRPQTVHVVPGLGLTGPDGTVGNLQIWVTLEFPPTPPDDERDLLRRLADAEAGRWNPRDGLFAAARGTGT